VYSCTLLVEMILGSRRGPALRVLDDVFLSREYRNFYVVPPGISPERASLSIDKPSGRIRTHHRSGKEMSSLRTHSGSLLHEMYVSG